MRAALRGLLSITLLVVHPLAGAAQEMDEAERATVRKTKEQLHFELPPDWPIERRGGLMQPIPMEEYLAMKFKSLEARLQGMEQRLQGLDIRLRVLEQSRSGSAGLKSSDEATP